MKKTNRRINLQSGQVMLTIVLFAMLASLAIVFGVISPVLKQATISKDFVRSRESYYLAESGLEDAYYRLKNNKQLSSSEVIVLNNATTTTSIVTTSGGKLVVSLATTTGGVARKMQTNLVLGTGIAFHYGVQVGQGGFNLQNSSTVTGNIHADGTVSGSGNMVYGDVISSGSSGLINSIHATGTAYAHTIQSSTVDKDAYYVTKTSTTVGGTSYPNSPDQSSESLPISDAQISQWESDAASGGSVTCSGGSYKITSNVTIGPKKIPCDLEISGSPIVTLAGAIWVTGNITIKNSSIVKLASSLGNQSLAIVADNPSNKLTSSEISLENSSTFQNSGTAGSFIFLISQNNSAETGGSEEAISMANSSTGAVVVFAGHGQISLQNSINTKEVTAYKIVLKNSANITYDTGLPSTLFSSGPGGGYDVLDWKEVQ